MPFVPRPNAGGCKLLKGSAESSLDESGYRRLEQLQRWMIQQHGKIQERPEFYRFMFCKKRID
jgi:hypothetical protein